MTRLSCLLPIAVILLSVTACAADSHPWGTSNVVGYTFQKERRNVADVPEHLLARRSKTVTAQISNEILLYFINVTVGTPPQPFSLQLDTGSSDIWFASVNADVCSSAKGSQQCVFGEYDSTKSSTYTLLGQNAFQIQYVDGTQIEGDFISDNLAIGSTLLTNMTMASATTASRGFGVMGIGFDLGESIAQFGSQPYPNVISVLRNEGFINTLAYSLWLDDLNSNTGSILFGGVDKSKYTGDLVALPIQPDSQTGSLTSFTVAWTGLKVTGPGQNSVMNIGGTQPAILDSGTTALYLPDNVANDILNGVGVFTDPQYGNVVPCSLGKDNLTFSFQFGGDNGPVVNIPLAELVTPLLTPDGSTPHFRDGSAACSFGINAAGSDPILFGDTFLRSAYVVYDLQNHLIGLANTNFNGGSSNVLAITSGALPGVSTTASAASVEQTNTNRILQSTATVQSTGQVGGNSRSATFHLVSATGTSTGSSSSGGGSGSGSGGGGSTSKSAAGPALHATEFQSTVLLAAVCTLISLLLGTGLIFIL